jgi:hypothetical protein
VLALVVRTSGAKQQWALPFLRVRAKAPEVSHTVALLEGDAPHTGHRPDSGIAFLRRVAIETTVSVGYSCLQMAGASWGMG